MKTARAIGVATAVLLSISEAQACGGFFCNQQPVDQTGEQIVFSMNESGHVTATIRINYAGTAEDFAWVVPVPAEPGPPEVGSDEIFRALQTRLRSSFYLEWNSEGSCYGDDYWGYGKAEASADVGEGEGEGEVEVSFRGAVGPYDAAVINSDDATALRTWLIDNGYDVPDAAAALIDPYVKQGDWFVALKLLSDRDVGDLQPIVLNFAFDRPCVPLRLTAIAALENMDVRLWVLGDARAIPTNYRHVLIDEAKIDWLCGGSNYQDVVTDAANETGGQAFVTEYAGPSDVMAGTLYWEGRFDLDTLATRIDPYDFLYEVMVAQFFPSNDQMLAVLMEHIPPPEGWEATSFYNSVLDDYELRKYLDTLKFDAVAATADLSERVVQPLISGQEQLDASPYLTQLFTTISPDEMTLDPEFSFNTDLPDVDNSHRATLNVQCGEKGDYYEIALADGRKIWMGPEEYGCVAPSEDAALGSLSRLLADLPGSEAAENLPEGSGKPEPVYSNAQAIDDILERHNAAVVGAAAVFGSEGKGTPGDGLFGCTVGGAAPATAWPMIALLAALAIVATRKRRSSR